MDTTFYCFGPFRLYPSEQLLLRELEPIPLAPKAFEVLLALVASDGHLMTREALMQAVWPRGFVEEINLTVNISVLRKALGKLPDGSQYIETIPKRGYRFHAAVVRRPFGQGDRSQPIIPPPALTGATTDTGNGPQPAAAEGATVTAGILPASTPSAIPAAGPRRTSAYLLWLTLPLLVLVLAASLLFVRSRAGRDVDPLVVPAAIHSLAVLPFGLISDDATDEYLGLGMADALITRLGGQGQVTIRPIGAVRRYTDSRNPVEAGRELEVDAVLDGTIQQLGGQTRVTARLLQVATGAILWTDTFDAQTGTAFALEDAISKRLARALALELSEDDHRPPSSRPPSTVER